MIGAIIAMLKAGDAGSRGAFLQGYARTTQQLDEQREGTRRFDVQQQQRRDVQDAAEQRRQDETAATERRRQESATAKLAGDVFELSEKARTFDDPAEHERFLTEADAYLQKAYGSLYPPNALRRRAPFNNRAAAANTQADAAAAVKQIREKYGAQFWTPEIQGALLPFQGQQRRVSELVNLSGLFPVTEAGAVVSDEPAPVRFEDLFPRARGTQFEGRDVPRDVRGFPDYREALDLARANEWVRDAGEEKQARDTYTNSLRARLVYAVRNPGSVNLGDLRRAMSKAGLDWDVEQDNAKRRVKREGLEDQRLQQQVTSGAFMGSDYLGGVDVPGGAGAQADETVGAIRAEARRQLEAARAEAGDRRQVTEGEIDQLLSKPENVAAVLESLRKR